MNVQNLDFEQFQHYTHVITNSKGRILEIPLRKGISDSAFIDQITFSIHESTLNDLSKKIMIADDDYMIELSIHLERIFGFGITKKNDFKGRLFYQSTYHLGDLNCKHGVVHYGGQNETIAIEITAEGCMCANSGWEQRLFEFLQSAKRPKITRVDIAHDFLDGEYTPDMAVIDFDNGGFAWTNRKPKSECRGTDWRSNDNTGKTFYVGSRQSSKLTRVYEKGKQLGDKSSHWTRFEIEFKAHDIHIPHDVLLRPGEFLGGAYPICESLFESRIIERIPSVIKTLELTEEKAVFYAKQQVGKLLNYLLQKGFCHQDIIQKLKPNNNDVPKRLNPARFLCEFIEDIPIHKQQFEKKLDYFGMVLN